MGKKNKKNSARSTLPDHAQCAEHTNSPYSNTDAKVLVDNTFQADESTSRSQRNSRDSHRKQQREQREDQTSQHPTSQTGHGYNRPIRKSRRLQQIPAQNAQSNNQGMDFNTSYTPSSYYAATPSLNHHTSNTTSSAYTAANGSTPSQNTVNNSGVMAFGWGASYAVPTSFNPTPVVPELQSQWLQMQIAQQMMMTQHMYGAMGNQPLYNNGGMQQQQFRPMSTLVSHRDRAIHSYRTTQTPDLPATFNTDVHYVNTAVNKLDAIHGAKRDTGTVGPPNAPVPFPAYLEQASKEPKDLESSQPLLVILDLNGTLLYRKRKKFPPQFIKRPELNHFLERLTSRHVVMVWSSSRPETVNAICGSIFSQAQRNKVVAKWGRDKLGLTPQQYLAKVQVYKQLEKVWADPKIQKSYPTRPVRAVKNMEPRDDPGLVPEDDMSGVLHKRWDQSNTVLIDDSTLKAAGNPYNILQVPEFTSEPGLDDTTVLKTVLAKIRMLAKSNDVSQRLRSWGEEGIKVKRDEVLGMSSSEGEFSEGELPSAIINNPSTTSTPQPLIRKIMHDGPVVGKTGEVFETEKETGSRALPKLGNGHHNPNSVKNVARKEKPNRKAKKRQRMAEIEGGVRLPAESGGSNEVQQE